VNRKVIGGTVVGIAAKRWIPPRRASSEASGGAREFSICKRLSLEPSLR
jgi:hypothetical protein